MRCRYCHNPDMWDEMGGTTVSAEALLDKAERYRSYWGRQGGITASGGEALLQMDFLTELFEKAHERKINTCLDTSAHPFTREGLWFHKFERLMNATDTVLLDIKHVDTEGHRRLTGYGNDNILDCALYLSDIRKPVWIRHVLVPEVTDKDELLLRLRHFLDILNNVERVEVLPYHTFGIFKWKRMGVPYLLEGVEPPSAERVKNAERILCR